MSPPRRERFKTVRIRRPAELARVPEEAPRQRRGGGWLPMAFFLALFGAGAVGVTQLNDGGDNAGASDDETAAAPPSARAHDARNHVVFRRTGRTLTIKIGRRAPERLRELSDAVLLECRHLGPGRTDAVYSRRLAWPEGARFNTLQLPGRAAAAMRDCSLSRRGRILARAEF